MAAVAIAADMGARAVVEAAAAFTLLIGPLYFLIEGIAQGGLRAVLDGQLLGVSILTLAAAAYSYLRVWLFVSSDPVARILGR